jgi:hypothetical protein
VLQDDGCVLCADESAGQSRFYFWYLNENYNNAATVRRTRAALGFCQVHLARLVEQADPATFASIYAQVTAAALAKVQRAEIGLAHGDQPKNLVTVLGAEAACPACERQESSRRSRLAALAEGLEDTQVRRAFGIGHPVCLQHLVDCQADLGKAARTFVNRVQDLISQPGLVGAELLKALRGLERWPAPGSDHPTPWAPAALGDRQPNWSGDLAELRAAMELGSCPACFFAARDQRAYLGWLSVAFRSSPYSDWAPALQLCRDHSWELLRVAGVERVEPLLEAMRQQSVVRLTVAGQRTGARDVRRKPWWSRSQQAPLAYAEREDVCPACEASQDAAKRTCELLLQAISDPSLASAYQRSGGVCLPHLPLALAAADGAESAKLILGSARVRLAVLLWELEGAGRRRAWDRRWEPGADSLGACRRAAEHVGGLYRRPSA